MQNPTQRHVSLYAWALVGLLALIWGGSFPANRLALAEVGVFTTVAFRVCGAAVLLWCHIAWRGLSVPKGPRWWLTCAILGLLNNAIPFTLIVWGQTRIDSGLAAILNASTAIFTVAIAGMIFADERMTRTRAIGVALGFAGVVVTIGPASLLRLDLTSLAQLAILGASLSYALNSIYARQALRGIRPEVSAAGMLTAASVMMLPLALLSEGLPMLTYAPATWAALAYLAAIASAFAYILFYTVLSLAGAGNLSLVTLLIVPIAVLIGAIGFGEVLAPTAWAGFALLAAGLLVIDGRIFRVKSAG